MTDEIGRRLDEAQTAQSFAGGQIGAADAGRVWRPDALHLALHLRSGRLTMAARAFADFVAGKDASQ